jgi:7-keto-8-aminopelargonate synthetase-like enzyme
MILIGHLSKKKFDNTKMKLFCLSYRFSGKKLPAINLGSYNYLGFAENSGPCSEQAIKSIEKYGVTTCSTRHELGTQRYMIDLENLMAKYLNVEDCIAFGMGFATNALNIPVLARQVKLRFFVFFRKIKFFL